MVMCIGLECKEYFGIDTIHDQCMVISIDFALGTKIDHQRVLIEDLITVDFNGVTKNSETGADDIAFFP
jgi:hypothetical protein